MFFFFLFKTWLHLLSFTGNDGKATSLKACKRMIPNWKLLNLALFFLFLLLIISSFLYFLHFFRFFFLFISSNILFYFNITIPIEIVQFFCFFRTKFHFEWHSLHHASNAHRGCYKTKKKTKCSSILRACLLKKGHFHSFIRVNI